MRLIFGKLGSERPKKAEPYRIRENACSTYSLFRSLDLKDPKVGPRGEGGNGEQEARPANQVCGPGNNLIIVIYLFLSLMISL